MFILESDQTKYEYADDTIIVWIDETGEESLTDKRFPVFGFGGCLCLASQYESQIIHPWRHVQSHFSADSLPLHAANLRPSETTIAQLESINAFFRAGKFYRFAAIVSDKTAFDAGIDIFHLAAIVLLKRISILLNSIDRFSRVVMIFEESQRINAQLADYFSRYDFSRNDVDVFTDRFVMPKNSNQEGLQVADFIAHTAGASVHSRLTGKPRRKDFELVFRTVPPNLSEFLEVTRAVETQGKID